MPVRERPPSDRAAMPLHGTPTRRCSRPLPPAPRPFARRLGQGARARLRRIHPAVIVWAGLLAGFAWAFVGSLLLGLGSGRTDRGTALFWLAIEVAIGATTLGALMLAGASPRMDRQDGAEDRPGRKGAGGTPANGT